MRSQLLPQESWFVDLGRCTETSSFMHALLPCAHLAMKSLTLNLSLSKLRCSMLCEASSARTQGMSSWRADQSLAPPPIDASVFFCAVIPLKQFKLQPSKWGKKHLTWTSVYIFYQIYLPFGSWLGPPRISLISSWMAPPSWEKRATRNCEDRSMFSMFHDFQNSQSLT